MTRYWKWLALGMKVKRWVALVIAGLVIMLVGLVLVTSEGPWRPLLQTVVEQVETLTLGVIPNWAVGTLAVIAGVTVIVFGLRRMNQSLVGVLLPDRVDSLVDIVHAQRTLSRGPRIVAIGGGTGLSTLLRGLKQVTSNLTAVVTVSDDGGSSGRLREIFGMPAPGDLTDCLVALSDSEPAMARVMEYRLKRGDGLAGHSFGNLFVTTLTEMSGDFAAAVRTLNTILAIRGRVLPATAESVRLVGLKADGREICGETAIRTSPGRTRRIRLEPSDVRTVPEVLRALREAELIALGPGSLFTSVIPTLLVHEIREAIRASTAPVVYISNLATESGETDGMTGYDHYRAVVEHLGFPRVGVVLVNSSPFPAAMVDAYAAENAEPLIFDAERLRLEGVTLLAYPLLDASQPQARHDTGRVAQVLVSLATGRAELRRAWR